MGTKTEEYLRILAEGGDAPAGCCMTNTQALIAQAIGRINNLGGDNNVVNLMDYIDLQTYIFDLDRLMPKLQELDNIYTISYADAVLVFYGVGSTGGNLVFYSFPTVVETGGHVNLSWYTLSIDMTTGELRGLDTQTIALDVTSNNELKLSHPLTINVGGSTYEYDGSQDVNITIADGENMEF